MKLSDEIAKGITFNDVFKIIDIVHTQPIIYTNIMLILKKWSDEGKPLSPVYKDIRITLFLMKQSNDKRDFDKYCEYYIELLQKYGKDAAMTICAIVSQFIDCYAGLEDVEEKTQEGILTEKEYLEWASVLKVCNTFQERYKKEKMRQNA